MLEFVRNPDSAFRATYYVLTGSQTIGSNLWVTGHYFAFLPYSSKLSEYNRIGMWCLFHLILQRIWPINFERNITVIAFASTLTLLSVLMLTFRKSGLLSFTAYLLKTQTHIHGVQCAWEAGPWDSQRGIYLDLVQPMRSQKVVHDWLTPTLTVSTRPYANCEQIINTHTPISNTAVCSH